LEEKAVAEKRENLRFEFRVELFTMPGMSNGNFNLRRATVDDLPALRTLWDQMKFSGHELEKRLTDFQVAVDMKDKVVGAIGIEIHQRHARLHSEAYSDFSAADIVRPMLWTRLQSLCSNHGVLRLWTQEQSPFWSHNGLLPPSDEAEKQKLPEVWRASPGDWLTLKLKDEEAIASLDREFAMFRESEKARTEETMNHARKLKSIATFFGFLAALLGFGAAIYMVLNRDKVASPHEAQPEVVPVEIQATNAVETSGTNAAAH
jgi:N-acetylglutamate synthase-like GNAT family acetyltransferase